MRKGFTPAHLQQPRCSAFLLAIICLASTTTNAQTLGKGTFRDGFPRFTRIDPALTQNVVLADTLVSLTSRDTSLTSPEVFALSGIDWRYPSNPPPDNAPSLISVQDVDKIPGLNLYLITDDFRRKVYIIRPDQPAPVLIKEIGVDSPPTNDLFFAKPVDAFHYIDTGNRKIVITDQGRHRVIQVNEIDNSIDWIYGDGTPGNGPNQLSSPSDVVAINNGSQALICDTGNKRVILIDTARRDTVASYTVLRFNNASGTVTLKSPVDVNPDPANSGAFLVTDQDEHRVMLINQSTRQIDWSFGTGQKGSADNTLDSPVDADIIANAQGNILIADAGNKRVLEVDRTTREIRFRFPTLPGAALTDLRDADRLTEGTDSDKTLVVANNQPINSLVLPLRLAYFNQTFESAAQDFSRPVDFDSLGFPRALADVPAGTRIRLQLRSANSPGDLAAAKWYGPKDTTDFYTGPITAINPVHDGQRFVQYRALLENDDNAQRQSDPRLTPILRRARISAHYFDTNITGLITSTVIRDSTRLIITSFQKLIVNTVLPESQLRSQIQVTMNIRDESGQNLLFSQPLSTTATLNQFDLSLVDLLRRRQAVRLQAVLKTNNSAVTPKLNDWQLEWENTRSTASTLSFTDPNGRPVNFYRVPAIEDNPPTNVGTVFLSLDDMNLLPIEAAVNLQIRAIRSGDQQTVQLTNQPTGFFILNPGYPAVMTNAAPSRLNIIEGRSPRDSLAVQYADPTDPTDISTARVVLIQNVRGRIQVENRGRVRVDTVSVNDSLFVRISGETDRDLSPAVDTVFVRFINTLGSDSDSLALIEVANNTGEFRSRTGIPIVARGGASDNDGKLQVSGGDQVRVEYIDLDDSKLQAIVQVRAFVVDDSTLRLLAGNKAFDIFVAPNPYNSNLHAIDGLRLAVVANTGDVSIQRIEIYNLAGERVRSLEGANIILQTIMRGGAAATPKGNFWWNLRNDSGALAASGTYWAKIYVRFTDSTSGATQATTALRKFVIVQ